MNPGFWNWNSDVACARVRLSVANAVVIYHPYASDALLKILNERTDESFETYDRWKGSLSSSGGASSRENFAWEVGNFLSARYFYYRDKASELSLQQTGAWAKATDAISDDGKKTEYFVSQAITLFEEELPHMRAEKEQQFWSDVEQTLQVIHDYGE